MNAPLRCPKCSALVVDRRSPLCTTCHAALPKDWIMTPVQIGKVQAIDREARAEHIASMKALSPNSDNILLRPVDGPIML